MGKPAFRRYCALIVFLCAMWVSPRAEALVAPEGLVGDRQQYEVKNDESLIEIARKFDLGYNAIVDANPGIDPFIPPKGAILTIPTAWILPAVSTRPAIIINIPEFRLYYFPESPSGSVVTFPLGIGDEGKDTPVGNYTVIEKTVNPAWNVPHSIRKEEGLPEVVPPGPNNPMGSHAMRLSLPSVLIHGTDRPWGIGRRSSHGCLRLYPEDIVRLYKLVPKGTRVVIVNQPLKVGAKGGRIYLEAHRYDDEEPGVGQAMQMLADRNLLGRTDFASVIRSVEERTGVPVDVTLSAEVDYLPSAPPLFDIPAF
jgi:L,D-transpeptidase ErfK/SrfK